MGAPPAQARTDRVTARRARRLWSVPQHHGRPVLRFFRTAFVVGAVSVSAAVVGCGSSTPLPSGAGADDGKVIFTDSCGGCHTLQAAGTNGGSGPNLTTIGLTSGEVANQV